MSDRFIKPALLCLSLVASIPVGELLARIALDEVNYLRPTLVAHPILRHAVRAGSGGHDRWGVRNGRVPADVDVLAIGDSETYGYSAPSVESWPSWLERLSGRSVYNMGLGGYGPPDYRYLLEQQGDSLDPDVVIIGFYFGNDLRSAYADAVGIQEESVTLHPPPDPRIFGDLRTWLSRNSVLYQAVKHHARSPMDVIRFRETTSYATDGHYPLDHPVSRTVFAPGDQLERLDQADERNRRGLEQTLEIFLEIETWCGTRHVACLYLLIPTKESVYWELASERLSGPGRDEVSRVVHAETAVREHIVHFLSRNEMTYVDPLPQMRSAAHQERLYLANIDGHPNGTGYRIIAETIAEMLADCGACTR